MFVYFTFYFSSENNDKILKLIWTSSFECSYCARSHEDINLLCFLWASLLSLLTKLRQREDIHVIILKRFVSFCPSVYLSVQILVCP